MLLICAASNGYNLSIARSIHSQCQSMGISSQVIDLVAIELPLYSPVMEKKIGTPDALGSLEASFSEASGFAICSPEYNGSIPPVLTNTIAWLSTQSSDFRSLFNGKPVMLATRSGGHGQKVLMAMRIQLSHLGCVVIGRDLVAKKDDKISVSSAQAVLKLMASLMQVSTS